jgi:DNA-binding LacI/PurR family transcriptional regulator
MAGMVSELLIDQIRGRLTGGIHLFTPELVVGKTTAPLR